MATLEELIQGFQEEQTAANEANEGRYAQLLGLLEERRSTAAAQLNTTGQFLQERIGKISGLLESSGRAAKRDATRRSAESKAGGTQSLIDRGLFNTTVLDAMQRREGEGLGRELEDINERVSTQRAGAEMQTSGDLARFMQSRTGIEAGLTGDKAGAIERRTDLGPNLAQYANLFAQYGQGVGSTQIGKSTFVRGARTGGGSGGGGGF